MDKRHPRVTIEKRPSGGAEFVVSNFCFSALTATFGDFSIQIFIWSSTNAEHSDPLSKRKKKKKKSLLVQSFCTRALWATLHLIKLFRVIFSLFNTYIRQVSL